MKKSRILCFLFLFVATVIHLHAGVVKGFVRDTSGMPLPYVSVGVKSSTLGVNTTINGAFFLELRAGSYTLVFSQLGLETIEKQVTVSESQPVVLNVVMRPQIKTLSTVTITTNGDRDKGREIMRKVIDNRSVYWERVNTY